MAVKIQTQAVVKKQHNFWNGIHFHPTDAIEDDWGRRILDTVAQDSVADTVRMYTMFEDIVTMDDCGQLCFDFSLTDKRLDYMLSKGFRIFLSYNFMPACIAKDPTQGRGGRYKEKRIITSPPKDYALWEEVCYQCTKHITERYGIETVSQWYLQCWNEPDLGSFFMPNLARYRESDDASDGRSAEYLKLYRHFAAGVSKVSDKLRIGGPALDGDMRFFDRFLKGVSEEGLKIDFVSIHTYGTSAPFHIENTLRDHKTHLDIIHKYFREIEVFVDEWGASGGGFVSKLQNPKLAFRDSSAYAAYFGKMVAAYIASGVPVSKMLMCLSGQHQSGGDFLGYRDLITPNFIKKPIYNAFVLLRKLGTDILAAECAQKDLCVLATSDGEKKICAMLAYASETFEDVLPTLSEEVMLEGLTGVHHVKIWRIDDSHTNPYTKAITLGIGEEPTAGQIALLQEEGNMKVFREFDMDFTGCNTVNVEFDNNALVLIEIA